MDKEMIAEYNKALRIASQYTTNIIRIRRLLSYNPITIDNGSLIISKNRTNLSDNESAILIDGIHYQVNPILLYP